MLEWSKYQALENKIVRISVFCILPKASLKSFFDFEVSFLYVDYNTLTLGIMYNVRLRYYDHRAKRDPT